MAESQIEMTLLFGNILCIILMLLLCVYDFKRIIPLPLRKIAVLFTLIIFGVTFFSSCSVYDNVTGYFNTYYNAKKLFNDAEYEIENTPQKDRDTNYFAIYNIPKGTKDKLDKVIEKCSKLIQFYQRSAWIDDAILMIGKAYIYKGENESALRKFKELIENFPESDLRYEAKLWTAVSLYQMKKWEEALMYSKGSLPEIQKAGEDEIILKFSMLEGQILFEREDYGLAAISLLYAALEPGDSKLMNNLYNKLGQCYEKMNEYEKAADAYGNGAKYKTDFAKELQTRLQQGRMLSLAGKYEKALELFEALKDEKLKPEEQGLVDLEIANNYWQQNDSVKAFELYTFIDSTYKRSDAAAKCHFQRGIIYEKTYYDLKLAHNYYEKAKAEFPSSEITAFAQKKALTLSNYFKYKTNLTNYDSLLRQAIIAETTKVQTNLLEVESDSSTSLKPFSSTSDTIHKSNDSVKVAENSYDARRNRAQRLRAGIEDTLQNIDVELSDPDEEISDYLEDDPLEISDVISENIAQHDSIKDKLSMRDSSSTSKLRMITDKKSQPVIVADPIKPDSIRSLIATTKFELAALFLNELNLLDSGMVWYNDMVTHHSKSPLVPRALYAISEIYQAKNDSAKVDSVYKIILERYNETDYAIQVKKNLGMIAAPAKVDSAEILFKHAENLLQLEKTNDALKSYQSVAKVYPISPYAPKALYTIGWIYENMLVNNDSAAAWYKILINEYPKSIYSEEVKPKVAVKDDPNKLSQFVKTKDIQAVSKTEAPKRAAKLDAASPDRNLPRDEQIRRQREMEENQDIEDIEEDEPLPDDEDDGD